MRRICQWAAVLYFVILVSVAAFVAVDIWRASDDPSFAGVWLIMVNPFTMVLPSLGITGIPAVLASVGIGLVLSGTLWSLGYLAPKPQPANHDQSRL